MNDEIKTCERCDLTGPLVSSILTSYVTTPAAMLLFLTILSLLFSAVALPTFSDLGSRSTLDVAHIHAFARRRERSIATHALTLQDPGVYVPQFSNPRF